MELNQILDSVNIPIPEKEEELPSFFKAIWNAVPMLKHEECLFVADAIVEKFPSSLEVKGNAAFTMVKNTQVVFT